MLVPSSRLLKDAPSVVLPVMPGSVSSVLVSNRLPEPGFTFMVSRSVSEKDSCVALRSGPVPLGTDGGSVTCAAAALATAARLAGLL